MTEEKNNAASERPLDCVVMPHTPGPWVASPEDENNEWNVSAEGWWVAVCADAPGEGTAEGNARLIATAPDLLRSLIDCEQRLALLVTSGRSKMLDAVAAEHARAVIAAALGHNGLKSGEPQA